MRLAAFLFSGDVKIAVKVSKTPSRGKNFKKKFLKVFYSTLSVIFWDSWWRISNKVLKAAFQLSRGNFKEKTIFVQNLSTRVLWLWAKQFLDFQQSFFRQFFRNFIFCVQSNFSRECFYDQLNHRSKTNVKKQINNSRKWKRISQTSGKTLSKIWSKLHSKLSCRKIVRNIFMKKFLLPLFPELCVEDFQTFANKFQ